MEMERYILKNDTDEVDIFQIHEIIIKKFSEDKENLPKLKIEIERLYWIIQNTNNCVEKELVRDRIRNLKKIIYLAESANEKNYYNKLTETLLLEFKKILNKPVMLSIRKSNAKKVDREKKNIIEKFLNIAKLYIDIETKTEKIDYNICNICNTGSKMLKLENNMFVCKDCGQTLILIMPNTNFKDTDRLNMTERYYYKKRVNFEDAVRQYQGKQNKTIPNYIYDLVYRKMEDYGLSIRDLTKQHIRLFFKEDKVTGTSAYYDDINLIHYKITGIPPPNITHLEQDAYQMFDSLVPLFYELKTSERKSFLNVQFVLYQILRILNWQCSIDDFSILETPDRRQYHNKMWKEICPRLGWPYYEV